MKAGLIAGEYASTAQIRKDKSGRLQGDNPKIGIDTGGMWGSYIGLVYLSASFVAIGTFASAISENQVIAFIIALLLCFFCYIGFEYLAASGLFGKEWL